MVNRSGDIGTAAETAVARWFQANGWPGAERRAKRGRFDPGDVTGLPGLCVEVKGGAQTRGGKESGVGEPGPQMLAKWLAETEAEQANTKADHGFLILKRKGTTDVGRWFAYIRLSSLVALTWDEAAIDYWPEERVNAWCRLEVSDLCALLRAAGYGNPLPMEEVV